MILLLISVAAFGQTDFNFKMGVQKSDYPMLVNGEEAGGLTTYIANVEDFTILKQRASFLKMGFSNGYLSFVIAEIGNSRSSIAIFIELLKRYGTPRIESKIMSWRSDGSRIMYQERASGAAMISIIYLKE